MWRVGADVFSDAALISAEKDAAACDTLADAGGLWARDATKAAGAGGLGARNATKAAEAAEMVASPSTARTTLRCRVGFGPRSASAVSGCSSPNDAMLEKHAAAAGVDPLSRRPNLGYPYELELSSKPYEISVSMPWWSRLWVLWLLCPACCTGRAPRVLRCVAESPPTNGSLAPLYFKFHKTGSELVKELLMERWLKCGFQLQPRFRYSCGCVLV